MPERQEDENGPAIGVVVVAYRSARTIEACVRSCLADPAVTGLVVQDTSSDQATRGIVSRLAAADDRVGYQASSNVGFACGCNAGVAHLTQRADWLAFVNPDVELERPLADLVRMPGVAGASVVGAHVESPRGAGTPSARATVTPARELAKAAVGSRAYAIREPMGGVPIPVGQVSGALLLVRRTDFEKLGGFDPRFELYYEDVDLCRRAGIIGGCLFVSERWGRHAGGVSASSVPAMSYVVSRVSRMRYLRKHFPGVLTEVALPLIAAVELVSRGVMPTREGFGVRWQGATAQVHEYRRRGSVRVLR